MATWKNASNNCGTAIKFLAI